MADRRDELGSVSAAAGVDEVMNPAGLLGGDGRSRTGAVAEALAGCGSSAPGAVPRAAE